MYKDGFIADPDPLHESPLVLDPIANLSEMRAHEVRRMPVYKDDLPSRVDVVGYVEPNKRIKQMVEAGIRIDAWNHAVYDFENPDEQDDGYTLAPERDDLDELDGLSEASRAKERYFEEMYSNYKKALKAQADAAAGVFPAANSERTENSANGAIGDLAKQASEAPVEGEK